MSDIAVQPETRTIVIEEVLPHDAATIWRTLTDGSLMARWMMEPTGFAPIVGQRFTFQTAPAGPWDGRIHCEVLEVVPNERLSYRWQGGHADNAGYGSPLDTVVTWTLAETEGGTRLRLSHAGFILPKNENAFETMGRGWKKVVKNLGDMVAKPN